MTRRPGEGIEPMLAPMRSMLLIVGTVGAASLLESPCVAQSVLRGVVLAEGGRGVADAEVGLVSLTAVTRTDRDGGFEFAEVTRGKYTIRVRAIGFRPVQQSVEVAEGDTATVVIKLTTVAVTIESLSVRADLPPEVGKMAAYYRRQGKGFGRFIDQTALAAADHSTLSDVFARIGGIRIVRRPQRCGGGFAVASGRGPPADHAEWMACFGGSPRDPTTAFPPACYLTVYLDGIRAWGWGTHEPPDLNSFSIASLQAIELYRGPAELPSELRSTGSACGAIVLWTK